MWVSKMVGASDVHLTVATAADHKQWGLTKWAVAVHFSSFLFAVIQTPKRSGKFHVFLLHMEKIIKSNKKLCNLLLNFIPNIYYFYGDSISIRLVFTSRNSNIILETFFYNEKEKTKSNSYYTFYYKYFFGDPKPLRIWFRKRNTKTNLKIIC